MTHSHLIKPSEICTVDTDLADVGGFAGHVGAGDDLEPGLAALHVAVVGDELHAVLRLYARVPASIQDSPPQKVGAAGPLSETPIP